MEEKKGKKIFFHLNPNAREVLIDFTNEDGSPTKIIADKENVFCEGDVVAEVLTPDKPGYNDIHNNRIEDLPSNMLLDKGLNTEYDPKSGKITSTIYGFATLNDRKIDVVPLFDYEDNNHIAYAYIRHSKSGKFPEVKDLRKLINMEKIIYSYDDAQIKSQLEYIKNDVTKEGSRIVVAEGTRAKDGQVELIELRKSMDKSVGKMLEDGRIDYKEKDFFITISKGELVAEKIPEVPPTTGVNIFGEETEGQMLGESKYSIGENIDQDPQNENYFIAAIDGVLTIKEGSVLNVENVVVINQDVSLETGNIHFNGTVEVKGSVLPGFMVEATGNVLVSGNIEDATVNAEGNIIVENGIIGKESCKVYAKGDVMAKFVQNADITCGNDLVVAESVVQSKIFAKNTAKVAGAVIGGEIIGKHGMEIGHAGSASEVKTNLTVGKDPDVEAKLNNINVELSTVSKEMKTLVEEITLYFGEEIFSNPKQVIAHLPQNRKIKCLKLLKDVKEKNVLVSKMKTERDKLKSQITFEKTPSIMVEENVFPEVSVRIKDSIKKIEKKLLKPHFKEDPNLKVIFWD